MRRSFLCIKHAPLARRIPRVAFSIKLIADDWVART